MNIELTDINGKENLAVSRITINQNFKILEDVLNTISIYLDTDGNSLSGIESLIVKKGDENITDILIDTNGSVNIGGNTIVAGNINGNSLDIKMILL